MNAPLLTASSIDAEALRRYRDALEEIGGKADDLCQILRQLSEDDGPVGRLLEREMRHIAALVYAALSPNEREIIAATWMLPQGAYEAGL